MFDFNRVIERRGTHASKWDNIAKLSGITAADAIPMWVADMDFAAPPGVTAALAAEVDRATHGYYADTGTWAAALADWMARRHGLMIDPAWVSPTPGIVSGLGLILQAVTAPGDEVVVFPPAYHAFRKIILANDRRIVDAQLVETNGRYAMDLDALKGKLSPRTKIVFFCSPHNPGGTVWSAGEIRELATFCADARLDLGVGRDPLRSRFRRRQAHADTDRRARDQGSADYLRGGHEDLQSGRRPCRRLRHDKCALKQKLDARIAASGLASYNGFGMIATEAGWRTGEAWLDALLPYLEANRDLFDKRIQAAAPGARSMRLDATYLAWVDFSGTGLSAADVAARVAQRARIFASPGPQFGPGGDTWLRFNFATPRPILEEAIGRLEDAFKDVRARS